jgi:hypothetical protein
VAKQRPTVIDGATDLNVQASETRAACGISALLRHATVQLDGLDAPTPAHLVGNEPVVSVAAASPISSKC